MSKLSFLQPTEFDSLKNVTEEKTEFLSIQLDLHLASILFTKQGHLCIWQFSTYLSLLALCRHFAGPFGASLFNK